MELPCVNCRQKEGSDTFQGIWVCADCKFLAVRVDENLRRELQHLNVLAREAIRLALIEGRLHLSEKGSEAEISKKELLQAIATMPSMKGAS